jgi:hypothetical protein
MRLKDLMKKNELGKSEIDSEIENYKAKIR